MRIVQFARKPRKHGNFSIEILFELVRKELAAKADIRVAVSRYPSSGFFKRLYNCIEAAWRQGDVNHILGDVTFLAAFLKKRKTITTILDCTILKRSQGLKFYFIKWFWFDLAVRKSRFLTAISQASKDDLVHYTGCDPDKVKVIYVSVSEAYQKSPKTFNTNNPVILQVGTAPNKNIPRLIEALQGIPCTLRIVGKLDEESRRLLELHQVPHVLNEKRLTDEEILEEYRQCDIVSFVSTMEGFGMPIVEANAMGRVVITSNTTSMPEVAGDAAYLCNPFEVSSIRQGVLKIIQDSAYRDQLISNGYLNARRFSTPVLAQQYLDLYREVYEMA